MWNSTKWLTAALTLALLGGSALAQDGAESLKVRQTTMKRLGSDLETVKAYIDDKTDQDKAVVVATDIGQIAKTIPDLFPPGTGMEAFPGKSGAKPVVWTEWDKFVASDHILSDKADALLAAVKGGDKKAVAAAFADIGKNGCGNCHSTFREKI